MFTVCVLQGELEFSPELWVPAVQSVQQQGRLLPELVQLTLGALVLLHQLLRAHCDPQQAGLAENVVGVAEAFQFVTVHGDGVLVSYSPKTVCVGGRRAAFSS